MNRDKRHTRSIKMVTFILALVLAFILFVQPAFAQLNPAQLDAISWIDGAKSTYEQVVRTIWENPELATDEFISAGALIKYLEDNGFSVEREVVKGLPTSFVATWGSGKPVIGFLAEFDALPGLSQEENALERKPVIEGAPGHGCGHHLYGAASSTAGIALAKAMAKHGIEGTVKVFGTPGEEGFSGKAFMAPEGIFDVADVVLDWHPGSGPSGVSYSSNTARVSFRANFYGTASHAGGSPDKGRSALDAAELMSIGVQYMREHIPTTTRVHHVLTSGGEAANVVPAYASAWYYVRQPSPVTMLEVFDWVERIAEGAALMTETEHEIQVMSITYDMLPNKTLAKLASDVVKQVGPPDFTAEDQAWGNKVRETMGLPPIAEPYSTKVVSPDLTRTYPDVPRGFGSADNGNVSWRVPFVSFNAPTWAAGTPGHSWQIVAQGLSEPAIKGALQVSKFMACTALELLANPEIIDAAKAEHEEYLRQFPFEDMMKGVPVTPFETLYGIERDAVPGRRVNKEAEYWKD